MAESTHADPFYTATANEANTRLYAPDELVEASPKITADTLMRSSIKEFKRDSINWGNLNKCRESYAGAFVVYNKEKQAAKGRVHKSASSVKSFFLPKEIDVEKVAEGESEAAKALKDSKSDYDNWKYQYADSLKGHLQDHGFESDQIDSVLKEEVIFDEYSRWRQERAKASVEDKKGLVKKALEWYRKSPVIQRAAVGAVLGVSAFAAVSAGATFIGIAGVTIMPAALIIRGGARFASAVAASLVGTPIGTAVISKATDLFLKIQPLERDIFSSQDEFIKAAQQYETGVLKKENAKRLVTISSAVVIGILVGGYTSHVFADNLPHIASTTGGTGGATSPEAGTSGAKGSSAAESAAKPKSAEVATKETPGGKKPAADGGATKKGAASGKKVNYTDLIEDETGPIGKLKQLKLWGEQHTASLKGIKKLFGLDKNSPEAKKIADFYDKGYISKEELPKLQELLYQGDKKISVEAIEKTVLYNPQTQAEFEHYFAEKQTNLSELKDNFHPIDDHIVRDGFTGKFYIDEDTGKFLYTGGNDGSGIAWQDADGKWVEALPPSSRPPNLDELKLIKRAYEQSGNAFTDGQKAVVASQLVDNQTFDATDMQQVIDMKSVPASMPVPDVAADGGAPTQDVLNLATIGRGQGVEHALIRQLKADPTKWGFKGKADDLTAVNKWAGGEAHRIATNSGYAEGGHTKIGVRDLSGQGKTNPAYVLEQDASGNIVVKEYLEGKSVNDAASVNQYEYQWRSRPVNQKPIAAASRPIAPPPVVEPPSPVGSSTTPLANTPSSAPAIPEHPRSYYADQLLDQAKIPAEAHSGLKETLVKDIAEKGNADPTSNEGKILVNLKNYFNYESLTNMNNQGWKKLKYLLESMVDNKGRLIMHPI